MKYIVLILVTILTVSCVFDKEDHSGHAHAVAEKKIAKKQKEEAHKKNEIHITKKQLETTKIVAQTITKYKIRSTIAVTGTIEVPPQSKATVYAPMEAFVYKTDLLPGDKVKKGEIIAVLQHPNFIELQYAYLESINKLHVVKADYERKKVLLENEIASKKSFQIVEASYRSAQSLVSSYASQLKMAGLVPAIIKQKGIQQHIAIKAPISGYVVENNLNKGMFLAANSEMMEIIDTDHMHAELNVFGTDITKIKKDDAFTFQTSGVAKTYEGYIKLISQKVDALTKTVNVHGHFEDIENKLKSGMFINANILLKGKEVFAVSEEAITEINGENFVFVAKSNTEFVPVLVTIGNTDKGYTEIKTIENNNFKVKVVVKGAHFLKGKLQQMAGDMDEHGHAH